MSDRVIRKKQGIKRTRSLSRVTDDGSTPMDVDAKFQAKKAKKPGRDVSGMRDETQVCARTRVA